MKIKISWKKPFGKSLGVDSFKSGFPHWWHQRISAVLMIILVSWMIYLLTSLSGANYMTAIGVVSNPVNASLVILFVAIGLWHATLGLQVVLEDYVSNESLRMAAINFIKFLAIFIGAIAIFSVLMVVL